jgi:hypothetical protein
MGEPTNPILAAIAVNVKATATVKPRKPRLPSCFDDHNAPKSVIALFSDWIRQADQGETGVIVVNRMRQPYSPPTVDRAVRFLIKHNLLVLVEYSCGRGNGNRYFVRWSFTHPTLSTRQRAVNHAEPTKTINTHPLEEKQKGSSHAGTTSPYANKPSKRALAWFMFQIRKELHDYRITPHRRKAITTGIGASLWRAMKSGAIQAGRQLAALLHEVIARLREACRIGEGLKSWCSWAGWCVRETIALQRTKLAQTEASAQLVAQIRREKVEAQGSVAAFLSEVGAVSLRAYIEHIDDSGRFT